MRIGIVTYRCRPVAGGAEAYLEDLFHLLTRSGHSVRIYQSDSGDRSPEIYSLPKLPRLIPKLIAFNIILILAFPKLVREDILIISYPEHYPPLSWHPRGIVISHGATWTHEKEGIRKGLRMIAARWAYRRVKGYVLNDSFTFKELGIEIDSREMAFRQVDRRRWYIPNCVDTGFFRRVDGSKEFLDLKSILVPRNLTYPRGIDLALEAFSRLLVHEPDLHLVIAGESIKDMEESIKYEGELRDMAARLNLQGSVSFTGRFRREEMPAVYSSALLTLIPSRMSEGTSLAALESMACGTPVVTTDVEGLKDLPGLKCPPTVDGILEGLRTALDRRDKLAEEQLMEVEERFSKKHWDKGWLEVIEQVAMK